MAEEKKPLVLDDDIKDLITRVTNAVIINKTKELTPIGYIDVFTIACDITEQVSNMIKRRKSGDYMTSEEKLDAACDIIVNLALRLKNIGIPGKNRTVLLEEDYEFIVSLNKAGVTDTIGTVISVVNGTRNFGEVIDIEFVEDVMKTSCLCFSFIKKKSKSK